MLIGIDASRSLHNQPTGTERYAQEILRHLLALPKASQHTWRLYLNRAAPDSSASTHAATDGSVVELLRRDLALSAPHVARIAPQVELYYVPPQRLWTHRALARAVLRHKPDVLFVPAHVIPFVWPRRRLPPTVVTVHDLGYHFLPQAHTHRQRLYLEWSTRWSAAAARRIIAVSRATATDLKRLYGTPCANVRVIHEALSSGSASAIALVNPAQRAAASERYNLQRPYVLYIGTIQPRKNLARLIRAYAGLCERCAVPWDLVLIGKEGWLSAPIHQAAVESSVSDRIHFLGYVDEADVWVLLSGALFFCFPSLFEGFGLPVLEAQTAGVPVMTANNSALPEVAGDAALLVDPLDAEAIAAARLRLSQDEELRQQLIDAGYENVKRFSWEKAARETLAVLEEAAQENEG